MRNIVIGFVGTNLDTGLKRRWRPTASLVMHPEFPVDRLELLHDGKFDRLAQAVKREVQAISPETEVLLHRMDLADPWDFQEVYGKLFDFARSYGFDDDRERYHIHLTPARMLPRSAGSCWPKAAMSPRA